MSFFGALCLPLWLFTFFKEYIYKQLNCLNIHDPWLQLNPSGIITPSVNFDPRYSAWEIVLVTFQSDLSIPAGALAAKDGEKNSLQFWHMKEKLAIRNVREVSFFFSFGNLVQSVVTIHLVFLNHPWDLKIHQPLRQIAVGRLKESQRMTTALRCINPSRLMFRLKTTISKKETWLVGKYGS